MKAKEYAARFDGISEELLLTDVVFKVVADIMADMVGELSAIGQARKCQTAEAWRAVVTEQHLKWKAVCRMLEKQYKRPVLREEAFMETLHKHGQELFNVIGEM